MVLNDTVKNKQKEVVYKCLKNFGLMDNVVKEFKEQGTLYYSERPMSLR